MKIIFDGNPEEVKIAERCLEVFFGDDPPYRQYAASILLHMLLKDDFGKFIEYSKEVTGFRVNDRNSSRVLAWKKRVKKAGKCEVCGVKKNLVAHHIVPWSYSISGRTDTDNGQCLCGDCHKMMHNDELWIEHMRKAVSKDGKG